MYRISAVKQANLGKEKVLRVNADRSRPPSSGDSYFNVTGYPFPLGPLTRRKTICREVSLCTQDYCPITTW